MRGGGRNGVGVAGAEVVVVGAGPAGAITALLLARRGVDVLLLDRAAFPRPKACGDCLSAAATDLLRRLGLLDRIRAEGAVPIDRWDIVALDGTTATGRFDGATALSLERRRFDAALADAARQAGARFRQAHVTDLLLRNGRVAAVRCRDADGAGTRIDARLVVGADGLRSVVARRLGRVRRAPRLRKVSLTAHLPAPAEPMRHGEMHLLPDGCLGYAPAGEAVCNLTLVVNTHAAGGLREVRPAAFFRERVRERARHMEDRAPASALAGLTATWHAMDALTDGDLLASGPFDFPGRAPIASGAALVGDAAGYYDPFTGQGVYHAMAAAERLVEAVAPAVMRSERALDRALGDYARARRRLTAPARRVQRGIEWVLSRPALGTRVLTRLAAAPAAMNRLVEVTGDLKPAASLLSPAVVSSFIVPPNRRFD